jgi:hypothetical protein
MASTEDDRNPPVFNDLLQRCLLMEQKWNSTFAAAERIACQPFRLHVEKNALVSHRGLSRGRCSSTERSALVAR